MPAPTATLRRIRLLVLDADGVLTDGRLHYGPQGDVTQVFNVRDGYGLKALMAAGIGVAVISGRDSAAVAARCAELGIAEVHQGVADKAAALTTLLQRLGLQRAECACIGDDVPDIAMMRVAALGIAVADAHPLALRAAARRTRLGGGAGAVREVCDWLLAARSTRRSRR